MYVMTERLKYNKALYMTVHVKTLHKGNVALEL